jgi:hypothetical protein
MKKSVKPQRGKGTGFSIHPENIKRESVEKAWWWREVFIREVEKKKGQEMKRELMARAQVDKAIKGDTQAFNAVADRMEGKPTQQTDITSDGKSIHEIIAAIEASKSP